VEKWWKFTFQTLKTLKLFYWRRKTLNQTPKTLNVHLFKCYIKFVLVFSTFKAWTHGRSPPRVHRISEARQRKRHRNIDGAWRSVHRKRTIRWRFIFWSILASKWIFRQKASKLSTKFWNPNLIFHRF
jgi:hypothetical protein